MPFYDYVCDDCQHEQEAFHGMNDAPEIRCESCATPMRRMLSAPSVIFKGSGFYATEYGKATHNHPKKSSSSDSSSTSTASETKSDSTGSGCGSKTECAKTESASSGSDSAKKAA